MLGFDAEWLRTTVLLLPPLLLSLTVHEYAHARVALAFGDPTAKLMGRVSLNPLVHLDALGTLMLIFSRFIGWAKPVPINPLNLRPRRLGEIMVSLAGPMSNLALATACGAVLRLWLSLGPRGAEKFFETVNELLLFTMLANVGLCVFNLIPLFPLDGHHVLREVLPGQAQRGFMDWQVRYGRFVLLALIIGPRLVESSAGRQVFDPVGYLYRNAAAVLMKFVGLF